MDLSDCLAELSAARWRFARTMPLWPHVYTVRDWWSDEDAFAAACEFIEARGSVIPWPSPDDVVYQHHYLVVDGLKFWGMGANGDRDSAMGRTVINCAHGDPTDPAGPKAPSTKGWKEFKTRIDALLPTTQL